MSDTNEKTPAPWEQQPGESSRHYMLARGYFELGPRRCLSDIATMHGFSLKSIKVYSSRYQWGRRARAYDHYLQTIQTEQQHKAWQRVTEENAERWARRLEQRRELEWEIAQEFLQKAREVLETSVEEKGWKPGDAVACSKMAAQLMQQVAADVTREQETSNTQETVIRVEYAGEGDAQ